MKALTNKTHFIVLPKAPKAATEELAKLYKLVHPELKYAQIVTRDLKWVPVGVLTRRTL